MTQEEIIQAISDDKMMPFIQTDQLAQIVAFVIKNYQPFLPSNIDEAAKEEYPDFSNSIASKAAVDAVRDAFKTGVKWMTEQGETFNGFISVKRKRSLIVIEGSSRNFRYGDNIIVQIRKKQ